MKRFKKEKLSVKLNSRLSTSILLLVMMIFSLAGATQAWFSAGGNISQNIFTTGTVSLSEPVMTEMLSMSTRSLVPEESNGEEPGDGNNEEENNTGEENTGEENTDGNTGDGNDTGDGEAGEDNSGENGSDGGDSDGDDTDGDETDSGDSDEEGNEETTAATGEMKKDQVMTAAGEKTPVEIITVPTIRSLILK